MKNARAMFSISMLFSGVCLQAVTQETVAKLEKERQEDTSKQTMPQLLSQLPPDLRREILKINAQSGVLNIPAIAKGITSLAATSKSLHAAINNPVNMLIILKSLPKAGAVVLAEGLRNMPGMQSDEVKEWLKNAKNALKNGNGQELYSAVQAERLDIKKIAELLANHNIDVNWSTPGGTTALMFASFHQEPEIVRMLIAAGANVNAQNSEGKTALMEASHINNWVTQKIELLLAAGADPLIRDKKGKSALDFAHLYRSNYPGLSGEDVVKLLENAEKAYQGKSARK